MSLSILIISCLTLYSYTAVAEKSSPRRGHEIEYCQGTKADFCGSIISSTAPALIDILRDHPDEIHISSTGGDARFAFLIGRAIRSAGIRVRVSKVCASSCLEVILPASPDVVFENSPVIAAHGNVEMYQYIVEQNGLSAPNHCISDLVDSMRASILVNVHGDIGRIQADKLGISNVNWRYNEAGCPHVTYDQSVDFWFPNSRELETYFGIHATGPVAGDDLDVAHARVACLFPEGTSFLIGDTVSISNSQLCMEGEASNE